VIVHVITGILIGAALGLRFKVLVVLPAIGTAVILISAFGLADGDGVYSAMTAILTATGIQFGYVGSNATEFFIASGHTARAFRGNGTGRSVGS